MSADGPTSIELALCATCHHRFVPADGVCPRCASADVSRYRVDARATVLASTELVYPSSGWPTPHRLVLVEVAESVRLLAVADAPLPRPGEVVRLLRGDGPYYRATLGASG